MNNRTKLQLRDREACYRDYEKLVQKQSYVDFQNALLAPTADVYVSELLRTSSGVEDVVRGKLALVTGVSLDSVGFYVAQELALQCGMHVVLLGKSAASLERCVTAMQEEAHRRQPTDPKPVLYTSKFKLSSLDSVHKAANACHAIASKAQYDHQISILVNAAVVGTDQARLTEDEIEYNTGCNFVATHFLTRLLLQLLLRAATDHYKPRVVLTSSIGHVLGRKFNPSRLVKCPQEGGAPEGYIVWNEEKGILEDCESQSAAEKPTESLWRILTTRSLDPPSPLEPDWQRVGTQVGRSKLAVLADAVHMARLYPQFCITSHHPGCITTSTSNNTTNSNSINESNNNNNNNNRLLSESDDGMHHRFSPSQAACAALRAALDPVFNGNDSSSSGLYLHCDGTPWHPFLPEAKNKITGESLDWETYCAACYQAAENVLHDLDLSLDDDVKEQNAENGRG